MPYVTWIERDATERGMQRGIQQGMQRGMQQGMQQGRFELLMRMLSRRCGNVAPELRERVRQLAPEQQDALAEALLDFRSEADLRRWLSAD